MSKARVFELAKELGLSSKELMDKLQDFGFAIASHMATLEEKEIKLIEKKLGYLRPKKKLAAKKAKPKKKKEEKVEKVPKKAKKPAKAKPKKEKEEKTKKAKKAPKKAEEETTTAVAAVVEAPPVAEPEAPPAAETPKAKPKKKKEPVKSEEEKPRTKRRKTIERDIEEELLEDIAEADEIETPALTVVETPAVEKPEKVKPVEDSAKESPVVVEEPKPLQAELEDETELLLEEKRRVEQRGRRRERRRRRRQREKASEKKISAIPPPPPSERLLRRKARGPRRPTIRVDEVISVDELARNLKLKVPALILELMQMNIMATKNEMLELEIVEKIADAHDFDIQVTTSPEDLLEEIEEDSKDKLKPRAPIVTVMGHVDHGKTALLDVIRRTNVMGGEAGGITQHIGAYKVKMGKGHVVFLDTPGHEAFTAMRAHGAQVTDVVVLVVAADDGIMPQTNEAIDHARAAGVQIVVAINKIDLPAANVDRVKQQLAEVDLSPEDWGGKTITVPVSAKTKDGIESLLEMLLLEAELLELKANPERPAHGIVLEAKLHRGRGPVATVLVQNGTLRVGDAFVVGTQYGRVRAMLSDKGEILTEAGPSTPVEVLGFTGVPQATDAFVTVDDEKKARQIADSRALKVRQKEMGRHKQVTLEDLYEQIQAGEVKELNIVIKGDVQGSIVALKEALLKLPTDSVKLNVIHAGVGGIKESDVILASASNALLIGFNVRPDAKARETAEKTGVDYRLYRVIYDLIDDVHAAMEGLLEPEKKEIFLGRAEVLQPFKVSSIGTVAGCQVMEGNIVGNQKIRLVREGVIVYEGKISSLKRYKEFAQSAPAGTECGIGLENFNDVKTGDVLESYRIEEVARKL